MLKNVWKVDRMLFFLKAIYAITESAIIAIELINKNSEYFFFIQASLSEAPSCRIGLSGFYSRKLWIAL